MSVDRCQVNGGRELKYLLARPPNYVTCPSERTNGKGTKNEKGEDSKTNPLWLLSHNIYITFVIGIILYPILQARDSLNLIKDMHK